MRQTLAVKILASHTTGETGDLGADAQRQLRAGSFIECRVDRVLANDITAPIAIREFEKLGPKRVFDREAVVLVSDHFTPNKDVEAATQCASPTIRSLRTPTT
jgi:3-isopropylmalate/(R)-2-methylmalate dehydratase large subunit